MQRCIVVLGMHRGGTSALMGVLNILGIELGSNYLNPSEDNPKGFFENITITQINEKILKSLNSSWDDVFFLPENWLNSEHLLPHRQEIIDIIEREFHEKTIFGIKDPRISRLLPLWNAIFKELSTEPHYIIPLRSPLEVAKSLQKRNGFSIEKSLLLWMNYMLDAEFFSRRFSRVFISFDELLRNPEKIINDISTSFDITFPKSYRDVQKDIEHFLEPALKHFTLHTNTFPNNSLELFSHYYQALTALTKKNKMSSHEDLSKIENMRKNYFTIHSIFYNADIRRNYEKRIDELEKQISEIEKNKILLEEQLTKIINSPEWKIFGTYYRLRDFILPEGSRRRAFTKTMVNAIRNPKGIIKNLRFKMNMMMMMSSKAAPFSNANRYDIIFFPVINWDFRYQRPQQIATRLAKNGHRVFYLSINLRKQASYKKKFVSENVYEITLPFKERTTIYNIDLQGDLETLTTAFRTLFGDFRIKESVIIVQFPLWFPLVARLKSEHHTRVIFDCLDEFSGFKGISADIVRAEELLLNISDFCIATSAGLHEKLKSKCKNISLIRNGTEFDFFHKLPSNELLKQLKKPIIGYYGAIAAWFDTEIVEHIAVQRPDWNIVLIGHTFGSFIEKLKKHKNIHFLGEKPYTELPKFLYWFDVCMIPFKLNELTLSTNPIKFYEFISSGKPVVSSRLPELLPFSDVLYLSQNKDEFLKNIMAALEENDQNLIKRRIELARANDWDSRFHEIQLCIKSTYPLVSIIIVTFNNFNYTKLCVESIYAKTAYPNYELIIVDNASSDGTQDYLNSLRGQKDNVKIIVNGQNLGFATGNNIGIREAQGDYIILLNNDTIVTRGWISGLIKYFKYPTIGMVGPVTNSIGNEAKINVDYNNLSDMEAFSDRYTILNKGKIFEIPALAMYCVALSRHTIEEVGLLDEQFAVGMFEDDDYALRVRKAGMKILCSEDVFIHHFGGVSLSKLKPSEYQKIFEENKRKYEQKWGIKWVPHRYREGVK
jgi:GT2 family glycosyltransferase